MGAYHHSDAFWNIVGEASPKIAIMAMSLFRSNRIGGPSGRVVERPVRTVRMKRSRVFARAVFAGALWSLLPATLAMAHGVPLPEPNPHWLAAHDAVPLPTPAPRSAAARAAVPPEPTPRPPIPRLAAAKTASADGTSHLDYAAILKPILSYSVSDTDKTAFQDVIHEADTNDSAAVAVSIAQIKDPILKKLATWYAYRSDDPPADAEKIEAFREANPDWPHQAGLREAAERTLFLSDAPASKVFAFFRNDPPQTGAGKAALAGAYLSRGDKAKAKALLSSAWREHYLDAKVEKKILAKFGSMLTPADDQARIDMLLYTGDASLAREAERIARLLPKADRRTVAARIAVVRHRRDAGRLLRALPEKANKDDTGLLFNRIQYLRRSDHDEEAWKMLLSAPRDPRKLVDLEQWWIERRINCRAALEAHDYRIAYKLAAGHGPLTGSSLRQAEFLAGWIALRFLHEPKTALPHFVALRAAATGSRSLAQADYWLGRTAVALGERQKAILYYAAAAHYPQHYYGQLGRQALGSKPATLTIAPSPTPDRAEITRFLKRDTVKAIGAALGADERQITPSFFFALARRLNDPAEIVLLAELAIRSGQQAVSVRLSKIAFNRDMPLGDYALPIGVIPKFERLGDGVNLALLHALSRQESEFNADARSPAGARGLMQLMPATARRVAREYKVKFRTSRLNDPAYNVQLGEAHLCDLIERYNGSYFLALVAYNAGPGRVREWIRYFGDPRDPGVDPIDWIESIPFTETRNYVMKIMESLQLYRSRLYGPANALQLWQDLNRGRKNYGKPPGSITLSSN